MSDTTIYPRFIHAKFGDVFITRYGNRALYIGNIDKLIGEDEVTTIHEFYVEGEDVKYYYNDGASTDGVMADDIIGRDSDVDESKEFFIQGWVLYAIDDCLKKCRRYISAVERRNSKDGKRISELLKLIDDTRKLLNL